MRSELLQALEQRQLRQFRQWQLPNTYRFSILLVCALSMMLGGCGGGASSNSYTPTPNRASAPTPNVTVLMQDAPADGVAAFSIDVTSASLGDAGRRAVPLTNSGQQMELRHMQLSPTVAFQGYAAQSGTYSSLSLSLSNPQLTVLSASGKMVRINNQTSPSAQLATSTTNIPVAVTARNSTHIGLMLDFDLEHSITNDKNGNYIITPVIKARFLENSAPLVKIHGALAIVTAVFFNDPNILRQVPINAVGQDALNQSFEVQLHDTGQVVPVVVDSSTVIDSAIGHLSNLRMGQFIYVSADFQNGTLLASSIAAGPPNLSQHYQGPVTGIYKDSSGNVSFDVVAQD